MASVSKKESDLHKFLDNLYIKNKAKIISWLDEIKKPDNQKDGKIPGLLSNSKIQIITATENGSYNMILQWIKNNADKFAYYDFEGIPNSSFISTADILNRDEAGAASGPARSIMVVKTFKTYQDVERWIKDPEIHPIKGTPMSAMSNEYYNIYEKAYEIIKQNFIDATLKNDYSYILGKIESWKNNLLPKNHILFGDVDLLYYTYIKKYYPHLCDTVYLASYKLNMLAICELLTEKLEDTEYKDTVLETEMELLRNRFNNEVKVKPGEDSPQNKSNMFLIKALITKYISDLVGIFFDTDIMGMYEYPERMKALKEKAYNIEGYWFINFLETNKMANGETPLKYFINVLKKPNPPNWISVALKLYNDYKLIIKDIDECFNPASGIVENVEDKKLKLIDDPLDEYFEVYENELAEIKKPIYSKLIDLTTFKPKKNLKYLNNAQYAEFKKEKDRYDDLMENYKKNRESYEKNNQGSSPKPPEKPTITLPWGTVHTIGRQLDPMHIRDEVVAKFREEYAKAKPIIDDYNMIKNMSYKELKYHVGESFSSAEKQLIEGNDLLSMTKEQIANNVLYDYSDLADKCSENIDILTNEELDDENYPLSKLQLIARLKVYTSDRQRYRTECIYAPKLYNYLIKCINAKEPFINPVTKAKYTQENIEELMKVMRIIDPKIEVPIFIKHRNDTKLKINYRTYEVNLRDFGTNASFDSIYIMRFSKIYISRMLGGDERVVYELCYIPYDIEATGTFATGSTDLTSSTMLYRIFKLFNEGRLLFNYLPPYNIHIDRNIYRYIKPDIHFNRIDSINNWLRKSNSDPTLLTKNEFIERFKHYAQEINNYTF